MKRFLLFGFPHYYPAGGWNDFIASFDEYRDAEKELIRRFDAEQFKDDDWIGGGHIIDGTTGERIFSPILQLRRILGDVRENGTLCLRGFLDSGYLVCAGNLRLDYLPKFDTPAAGRAWLKENHSLEIP